MVRGLHKGQKAALLISECQIGIVDEDIAKSPLSQQVGERRTLQNIAAFAEVCRKFDVPVVHCPIVPPADFKGFSVNCVLAAQLVKGGMVHAGDPRAGIHPLVAPQPGDIVSERCHGMSAMHGTELEWILRGLGVSTVLLAGVSTNIALPGIALEAINRGMEAIVVEDCTAGGTAESHAMQIKLHLPLLAAIASAAEVTQALQQHRERS